MCSIPSQDLSYLSVSLRLSILCICFRLSCTWEEEKFNFGIDATHLRRPVNRWVFNIKEQCRTLHEHLNLKNSYFALLDSAVSSSCSAPLKLLLLSGRPLQSVSAFMDLSLVSSARTPSRRNKRSVVGGHSELNNKREDIIRDSTIRLNLLNGYKIWITRRIQY